MRQFTRSSIACSSALVAVLLLVLAVWVPAADAANPELSAEQMETDLRFMILTVGEVHPALGEPEAREAFETRARTILEEIHSSMPLNAFNLLAARVMQALPEADAHTTVGFQPDNPALPVRFDWVSDGLVIAQAEAGAPLRRGDAVVHLGGLTPEELLEGLRPFIPAENDSWVRARGKEVIRYRFMLEALGAAAADGSVHVAARRHGEPSAASEAREVEVALESVPSRPQALRSEEPELPWFGWRIEPEHSLGLFWLDRCVDTPEYRDAVDAFFAAVENVGVEKVAIDVRRNTGGNSAVLDAFLKYVPAETVRMYGGEVRLSPQANAQRGYTLLSRLIRMLSGARPSTVRTPRPSDPELIFDGDLYVLTSERTFSSGVWIAVVLSDNGLATVVGEPTGGTPSGYGDILRFQLPETGLSFAVSHKRWIRPDPAGDPADTLMPDRLVPTTVDDIRLQRDPQLEWVRSAPSL